MFYQIFFSPQVKRCAIITCIHGICELPHELPNDLSLSRCAPFHTKTRASPRQLVSHRERNPSPERPQAALCPGNEDGPPPTPPVDK